MFETVQPALRCPSDYSLPTCVAACRHSLRGPLGCSHQPGAAQGQAGSHRPLLPDRCAARWPCGSPQPDPNWRALLVRADSGPASSCAAGWGAATAHRHHVQVGRVVAASQQQGAAVAVHRSAQCRRRGAEPVRSVGAAAQRWHRPMQHPPGPLCCSRQPARAVMPGAHSTWWLCEVHCNMAAIATPETPAQAISLLPAHHIVPCAYLLLQVLFQPSAVDGCGKTAGEAGEQLFAGLSPLGRTTCHQSVAGMHGVSVRVAEVCVASNAGYELMPA